MNLLKKFTQMEGEQRLVATAVIASALALLALLGFGLVKEQASQVVIAIAIVILLVTLGFTYSGNLQPGKIVIPLSLWTAASFYLYTRGVRDVSSFAISALIVLAGILLGERGAMVFGLLSGASVIVVTILEFTGVIVRDPLYAATLQNNLTFAALVVTVSFLQYLLVRRLTYVVEIARQHELQQIEANKELRFLQTDLEQRVQQRTAQLRATNEVGQVASSILDPDVLMTRVVNLIKDAFGYYYAAVFVVVDNERWAELKEATGTAGQDLKARKHRLQVGGSSMVGSAIANREPEIALDVGEAATRFNNPLLPNTRSEVALPLIVGDRVIGALDVQSTREADFKPDDISTLQSMANQIAIAIENARLFRETSQTLEELQQANRQYITAAWGEKLQAHELEHSIKSSTALASSEDAQEVEIGLSLRDQSIGQIRLQTSGEWSSEDQAWVESLATQVAISLENARLIEESQQSALRERLSASIIQKLWSANTIDGILQTAVRELGRALEAAEASIELKVDK